MKPPLILLLSLLPYPCLADLEPSRMTLPASQQIAYSGSLLRTMTRSGRTDSARLLTKRTNLIDRWPGPLLTVRVATVATTGPTSAISGAPEVCVSETTLSDRLAFQRTREAVSTGLASDFIEEWTFPSLPNSTVKVGDRWTARQWLTSGRDFLAETEMAFHAAAMEKLGLYDCMKIEAGVAGTLPMKWPADQTGINAPLTIHEFAEKFWIAQTPPVLIKYERRLVVEWSRDDPKDAIRTEETVNLDLDKITELKAGDLPAIRRQFAEMKSLQEASGTPADPEELTGIVNSLTGRLERFKRQYRTPLVPEFAASMNRRLQELEAVSRQLSLTEKAVRGLLNTPAPPFTLNDLDGRPVSLPALRGKVVLVSFWKVA